MIRSIIIFMTLLGVIGSSCTKDKECSSLPSSLDGKWRMIIVKDNLSGSLTTKPNSIQGDVDITFTSLNSTIGTFIGNTPSNDIYVNNYYVGSAQSLSIPTLNMTKINETSWGILFVDNINFSQKYVFVDCRQLEIITAAKTLTFQKL